jgi:NodT family efflux transporter outer membrane factor (OMF) lipoprotein
MKLPSRLHQPLFSSLVFVLVLVVTACAVGPEYRSPQLDLKPIHNFDAVRARSPSGDPPTENWWDGFKDPELTHVVEVVLRQNLDIQLTAARLDQSRAIAQFAGAQRLPAGELAAQSATIHQSLESPIGTIGKGFPGYQRNQTLRDLTAGASWEIDLFGGLHRNAQAARADADAAAADARAVRLAVAAEAADAYLQIRGDQARITLAQSQVQTDERLLELIRLRLAAGAATDREIAQGEALVAHSRGSLPPLRRQLEAQLNRLDVLMGNQPGTVQPRLLAPTDIPSAPNILGSTATPELIRLRPDVSAAERRIAAANARIGAATAEYYPNLSLSALLGFESLSASRMLSSASFQPAGVAGLHWRLFDFGRVDAEVAQADAASAASLISYRKTVLVATEEIENAFSSLVQLEAQNQELVQEIDALSRSRDAAQAAYLGGAIDLTDVLDADRQLLAARDEYAETRAGAARAAVSSFRALGGAW